MLLSAEGVGTNAIMRETGKSKTCVWRWQERFAVEGVDGLLRDKTRPSRIPKLDPVVAERVVALTMEEPPQEATHWTSAAMAAALARRTFWAVVFYSLITAGIFAVAICQWRTAARTEVPASSCNG